MGRMKKNSLFSLVHDYFTMYLPAQQRSPNTIRSYQTAIVMFLEYVKKQNHIEFKDITFEMLTAKSLSDFLGSMEIQRGCSTSSCKQRLHCIRAFFSYAAEQDINLVIYWEGIKKVKLPDAPKVPVNYLSEKAVESILSCPDQNSDKGIRNMFLMLFLYQTGARIQELLDIRLTDIHWGTTVTVTLHGKGRKTRSVPIVDKAVSHLKKYVSKFHPEESQYSEQYLFYVVRNNTNKRMTEDNARRIVARYGNEAKRICPEIVKKVHPHLFRHSRAMHLYQNGLDLTLISQWLGHSQFETTLIYAHADTELKRQAIERALPNDKSLAIHLNADRFQISDEETLKRLCGLR